MNWQEFKEKILDIISKADTKLRFDSVMSAIAMGWLMTRMQK